MVTDGDSNSQSVGVESDSDSKSESKSDFNSESDSESDVNTPPPKPMDDQQKLTPVQNPNAHTSVTSAKRNAREGEETEHKKLKKQEHSIEAETSEKKPAILALDCPKKPLFQRLWSDDDEVIILKGLINYESNKKSDIVADWNALYDFIKKDLVVEVTKSQLRDKIRRIKKKFMNRKKREKGGKNQIFLNSHDKICYKLSNKIWGKEIKEMENVVEVDSSKKIVDGDIKGQKKMEEVEIERKKLKLKEMKLHLKTLEVMRAQTKFELDVLKSKWDDCE